MFVIPIPSEVGENAEVFSPVSVSSASEREPEPTRVPSDAEWP